MTDNEWNLEEFWWPQMILARVRFGMGFFRCSRGSGFIFKDYAEFRGADTQELKYQTTSCIYF